MQKQLWLKMFLLHLVVTYFHCMITWQVSFERRFLLAYVTVIRVYLFITMEPQTGTSALDVVIGNHDMQYIVLIAFALLSTGETT